ncbi:DUF5610 domain-containing protein [Colwellia psychrerythraea]|uniref:DUF5610 domain-containing protein n=1 Tax=Colwellia psychrerythraea TaxID=28229 RepID=A0A099L3U7_COLPS|nr:DUF5610 domain-containing protein [Colwellia psychrerythraea]KGJ96842.1 hypothetical protein GAB14E_1310 [Colwellia psychrerythraea]
MSSSINSNSTFSQDVRSLAKVQDKTDKQPMGQQVSELAHEKKMTEVQEPIYVSQKKQLNAAIIESSLKFSNTIGDQPLSLVLKTALQGINEALKAGGVESNVEDAFESGVDFSPEATAERIVAFSTQFLASYREQHPEMGEEESLTAFVDIISGGIEQGFAEAKDILGGLNVFAGDIATNIDKTYQLVQDGLQSFIDAFSEIDEE